MRRLALADGNHVTMLAKSLVYIAAEFCHRGQSRAVPEGLHPPLPAIIS
jgi:hypothetical protein